MLSFLKKLFGINSTPVAEAAPYKVEAPSFIAVGEPPATVIVPVTSSEVAITIPVAGLMLPVEGAGVVEVTAAPKKKAAPKKPAAEKKPRAKKAPKAE